MKKLSYSYISLSLLGMPVAFSSNENSNKESQQMTQHDTRLAPLVAKLNTVCGFEGQLRLNSIKTQENSSSSTRDIIGQIHQKMKTKQSLVVLTVKDGTLFFPYYFDNITYVMNNSSIMIENSCQSSVFSLHDDKIQNALGADNLGGSEWSQENVSILNWKKEWKDQNLKFLVAYNDKLFEVLPTQISDEDINQISPKEWHSSLKKKVAATGGTAAVIAGLLYELNNLINGEITEEAKTEEAKTEEVTESDARDIFSIPQQGKLTEKNMEKLEKEYEYLKSQARNKKTLKKYSDARDLLKELFRKNQQPKTSFQNLRNFYLN